MIPRPAQYLLRFDDLCPTYARDRWQQYAALIGEFGIRPILAVVPENRDPALEFAAPDPDFWPAMRTLEAAGATIGLHGYRHACTNRGRSLVPLHRESEFAGIPEPMQRQWIREGIVSLRSHGLDPTIWVAPRHGFDRATLRALRDEGMAVLSDGFARRPYLDERVLWIPQQLWAPAEKRDGLWTICLHANTAADAQIVQLRDFLDRYAAQFTCLQRVVEENPATVLSAAERLAAAGRLLRTRARRAAKKILNPG